jgi:hypothetical protein
MNDVKDDLAQVREDHAVRYAERCSNGEGAQFHRKKRVRAAAQGPRRQPRPDRHQAGIPNTSLYRYLAST